MISENNRVLSRYHILLQQQKQKSALLKNELMEKEAILNNVKGDLDAYNDQLRKNAQELLQVSKTYCLFQFSRGIDQNLMLSSLE